MWRAIRGQPCSEPCSRAFWRQFFTRVGYLGLSTRQKASWPRTEKRVWPHDSVFRLIRFKAVRQPYPDVQLIRNPLESVGTPFLAERQPLYWRQSTNPTRKVPCSPLPTPQLSPTSCSARCLSARGGGTESIDPVYRRLLSTHPRLLGPR